MLQSVRNLFEELSGAGQDAGLEGDLLLDTLTGWLQVALGDGERLARHLKHNCPNPPHAPLQLRDRADIWWQRACSRTTGRVISNQAGKVISRPGTPLRACYHIAAGLDDVRVEPELAGIVMLCRPARKGLERSYELETLTPASRGRWQRVLEGNWPTRVHTAEGWVGLSSIG